MQAFLNFFARAKCAMFVLAESRSVKVPRIRPNVYHQFFSLCGIGLMNYFPIMLNRLHRVKSAYDTQRGMGWKVTFIYGISGACHHWVVNFEEDQKSKELNGSICLVVSYLENKQISDHSSDYNKTS